MIIDAHADTIERAYTEGWTLDANPCLHLDWPRLRQAGYRAQVFALWVSPEFARERALYRAMQFLSFFARTRREAGIRLIQTPEDLEDPSFGAILSLEGAGPLVDDPSLVEVFHSLGIRMISLTWNERNPFADGLEVSTRPGGLTSAGRQLVREIEEKGIVLDLSHLSEPCFWEAIEVHGGPVVASHANARALCDHPRNLTDDQLRAVARSGGVIGVCFAPRFLAPGGGTIEDAVRHIEYLRDLVGVPYIGLGSDFDGISSTPPGLSDPTDVPRLLARLRERGFSAEEIQSIAGENWRRLFQRIWKA